MTPDQRPLTLGTRLIVGKHAATIRYVGPVEGQQGEWVGLEWDEASRGKHDGSHSGVRYFSCARGPTAGSLVRLPKLLEGADLGQPLAAAIQARYKNANEDAIENDEAYVPTASHRHVPIQLVGAEAAAAVVSGDGNLHQASFVGMKVSSLNVTTEVTTFLSNVASLDLSDNLCGSWNEVTTFISALPSLQVLNMSGNVVDFPWRPAHQPLHQCSLTTLVLNRCGITWQQAVAVGTYLPSLRALHLCSNAITSLLTATDSDLLAAAFPSLATLDLEDNQLRSWEEVQILRHLPKLHTLLLSGNELQSITYESGFVTLQRLMLGSNRLAHWSDVDQLDAFPDLHDIRLSDNPLTEHDPGAARYEVIARIDRLTSFNGSEVKQAERRDAELAYMRRVTDELAASATEDKAAVAAAHPRFGALTDKYGELAAGPGAAAAAKGSTLSSGMVELVLVAGSKALKKKLPGTLTVGRLKPLLERLMRVKVAHQALMLVPPDADGNDGEEITHDEGRELNFFGVTNGWKIVVQVRSPEDAAAAAAAARRSAAALQELRMEEHEAGLRRLKAEQDRLMAK